jgi:hypothetical protein
VPPNYELNKQGDYTSGSGGATAPGPGVGDDIGSYIPIVMDGVDIARAAISNGLGFNEFYTGLDALRTGVAVDGNTILKNIFETQTSKRMGWMLIKADLKSTN